VKKSWAAAVVLGALLAVPAGTWAKKPKPAVPAIKATPPEEALRAYIGRVRAQQAAEVRTPGSLWSPNGQLVRLGTDVKAFRIHDVVMIVVGESLTASTDGQVKNSRASSANSGITSLFGALKASNALQNLVGATASSGLTAQGQSTTDSSLATTFGAEVVDVLPNGMLVVQATRQITFSQQTQLITLRGLVRPRRCEQPEPGAFDGHDRSRARRDGQGDRERLNVPAESAGALCWKSWWCSEMPITCRRDDRGAGDG
jgi:flagellar L-ring protein FlgH